MYYQKLKETLKSSIAEVTGGISAYVEKPGRDMTRVRKVSPADTISFLVSLGAGSTKNEITDYYGLSHPGMPTESAVCQRRYQLKPEALEAVFRTFTDRAYALDGTPWNGPYRYLAADGTDVTFPSMLKYTPDDYYVDEGHPKKGYYSMHVNALYDLEHRTYMDAVIQPVHKKDEFRAFCELVDRDAAIPGVSNVYMGDRGYCSYNNMAHVMEKGQYFLFRTKDIGSKGLVGKFELPDSEEFDITVNVTLTRTNKKSVKASDGHYRRYIDAAAAFDFLEYGSDRTYDISFRVVRFEISEGSHECIVTNLPGDGFPMQKIKEVYNLRWGVETSFRKLKHTIGLTSYHSYKPAGIMQEVWAKLTAYNATEFMVSHTVIKCKDRKYSYAVNFAVAAHICRLYIRLTAKTESVDVASLLDRELVPVRPGRQFPRLSTAHFRKPKFMVYRAS